jgi:hypothetical protein
MGVFLVEWRLCFFKNDTIVQELSRNLVFHCLQLKKIVEEDISTKCNFMIGCVIATLPVYAGNVDDDVDHVTTEFVALGSIL